ncbi:MAG: hypothetical protein A3A94_01435 [Candidatus Portnoybacteria bacterium RIFCSPLOWO2_01_FULL_43_11]|uniref:UDP-N-acetylmuramyl-tripeptide synthetase n=1 Tax=Candidatus Portnoybacteria bacterium RIFCSPLOWO2_01_FULL_43_11 TaxID=1802000 RepID=A0A1G2FKD5_9BACT|nr:MAG: hypothetical protein A3A94_01435 [Candidatus Portnoybacteria bacterium RIFCSPLOWO2_01_FULL_43_11]
MIKNFLRKLTPKFLLSWYHFGWALLGVLIYRFPSKKIKVIGVTGTKGKTTTCNLITDILNYSGFKTGMMSTVNFKIGEKNWINQSKQTMLGRFKLQKMLRQMVKEKCQYAVIETSSEGILQHRHRFIDYEMAVFTNLSPEHLERHRGFENYRAAKIKLFEKVAKKRDSVGVYNLDDENVEYFLAVPVKNKYGYGTKLKIKNEKLKIDYELMITNCELTPQGTKFTANNVDFEMKLLGEFNIYNAAAAICLALSRGISMEKIKEALIRAKPVPGRMEVIDKGQDFTVVVDYAHEPVGLEQVYQSIKIFHPSKIIALLGAQGGGRDKSKRAVLGEIAGQYADYVIVTNEDPYDEPPLEIIQDVMNGVLKNSQKKLNENVFSILDRRQAIIKALNLAQKGDSVILTGKGGEVWMCVENNRKILWDEKKIVEEELEKLYR